jgi:hypothetical protein
MAQFFKFESEELLERSRSLQKYLPYSFSDLYVNVNQIISVQKLTAGIYKIFIGEKDYYIKEDTFERLKLEVLDAKQE